MSKIVSNSSPLIYLAKCKRLSLLKELFGEVLIPAVVKKEVIDDGIKLGKQDAYTIDEAIKAGWIKVHNAKLMEGQLELDIGEAAAISLAKQEKSKIVLMDDNPGRAAAKLVGLKPLGTVGVLLLALKRGFITFESFLAILSSLVSEGFRLKEDVLIKIIEEAEKISKVK